MNPCGIDFCDLLSQLTGISITDIQGLPNGSADVGLLACTPNGEVTLTLDTIKDCVINEAFANVPAFANHTAASAGGILPGQLWKYGPNTEGMPLGVLVIMPDATGNRSKVESDIAKKEESK